MQNVLLKSPYQRTIRIFEEAQHTVPNVKYIDNPTSFPGCDGPALDICLYCAQTYQEQMRFNEDQIFTCVLTVLTFVQDKPRPPKSVAKFIAAYNSCEFFKISDVIVCPYIPN